MNTNLSSLDLKDTVNQYSLAKKTLNLLGTEIFNQIVLKSHSRNPKCMNRQPRSQQNSFVVFILQEESNPNILTPYSS